MASKRRVRRRECGSKVGYHDVAEAHAVIRRMRKDKLSSGGRLEPYRCQFCGQIHIGHAKGSARMP